MKLGREGVQLRVCSQPSYHHGGGDPAGEL